MFINLLVKNVQLPTCIGESKRALHIRLDEHKDQKDPKFVVSLHMIENRGHFFNWDDTQILERERERAVLK